MKYKRILLKLSGEALAGDCGAGINQEGLENIVSEIKKALKKNVSLAIVVGGGNIWRGAGKWLDRVKADHMGMLATIMNAIALGDMLEKAGVKNSVLSAIDVSKVAEFYTPEKALRRLGAGKVLILAAGTGNPFFTTDTTAALRASEIKADVILKATQVDGVYDCDPKKNPKAKRYEKLSFAEAINKDLKVMDTAAFTLAREAGIPIIVFDFHKKGNLEKAVAGKSIGTLVY
jgi:uridylate kinase